MYHDYYAWDPAAVLVGRSTDDVTVKCASCCAEGTKFGPGTRAIRGSTQPFFVTTILSARCPKVVPATELSRTHRPRFQVVFIRKRLVQDSSMYLYVVYLQLFMVSHELI